MFGEWMSSWLLIIIHFSDIFFFIHSFLHSLTPAPTGKNALTTVYASVLASRLSKDWKSYKEKFKNPLVLCVFRKIALHAVRRTFGLVLEQDSAGFYSVRTSGQIQVPGPQV